MGVLYQQRSIMIMCGIMICCLVSGSLIKSILHDSPKESRKLHFQNPYSAQDSVSNSSGGDHELYMSLVLNAVSGTLYDELGTCKGYTGCSCSSATPFSLSDRRLGLDWPLVGHTMIGVVRLQFIKETLLQLIGNNVPGDFVEMGVWRGGSTILAKAIWKIKQQNQRRVFVFDVFDKMAAYGSDPRQDYLSVPLEQVKHNFEKYGLLDDNVHFVKGLFEDTVPSFRQQGLTQSIAFLRIDGNFYSSYHVSLYHLYDLVPIGGVVYFDDIPSHPECHQAWMDFKKDQMVPEDLTFSDGDGSWFVKTKAVNVDFTKF